MQHKFPPSFEVFFSIKLKIVYFSNFYSLQYSNIPSEITIGYVAGNADCTAAADVNKRCRSLSNVLELKPANLVFRKD